MLFFSGCFQDFFFVFHFQKFDYDVSELGPSWVYPVWGLLSTGNDTSRKISEKEAKCCII